jgi:hypothetical protein
MSEYELDCLEYVIRNLSPKTKGTTKATVASIAVDCFKTALYPSLMHKHKCKKCRTIWEHPEMTVALGDSVVDETHTCPKCGRYEENHYTGRRKPQFKQQLITAVKTMALKAGQQ